VYEIKNVPVGSYNVKTWHERYGELTKPVKVTAGGVAAVDLAYTGNEKPPVARLLDVNSSLGEALLVER
jgi:hypothetical protein